MTGQQTGSVDIRTDAQQLAANFPPLILAAQRLANAMSSGVHGHRRAGPGDSFWQFRLYQSDDPGSRIDWRQSAKGQHLFVREQEHESVETFWIWCKCGETMDFQSDGARRSKKHSAMILTMALALLLQQGGEKFGLLDASPVAFSGLAGFEKFTHRLLDHGQKTANLPDRPPQADNLPPRSVVLLISDFLEDPAVIEQAVRNIAARGCQTHLLQIIDPAEAFFPFRGHLQFTDHSDRSSVSFGRAEAVQEQYRQKFQQHKDEVRDICRQYGCNLTLHDTGQSENIALLAQYLALKERR